LARPQSASHRELGITVLGDDLYCKQPISTLILENGLDFILVCKPDSHKTLYQWLEEMQALQAIETVVEKRWTGKTHRIDTYRFINQVPLRDGEDALDVNWCELTTIRDDGKVVYKNAFATNHSITETNVAEIVRAGRARWKVENENNNTLKTKGYHLTHNFGHGKRNLSSLLATFNLLAFLFHTVLLLVDQSYQLIRQRVVRRDTFFEHLRTLTRYLVFESWQQLITFMLTESEPRQARRSRSKPALDSS